MPQFLLSIFSTDGLLIGTIVPFLFVLTVVVCLLLLLAGFPMAVDLVRGWAPQAWVDAFAGLSFLTHFQAISRGVLDLRDAVYFLLCIAAWLAATVVVIDMKKAD